MAGRAIGKNSPRLTARRNSLKRGERQVIAGLDAAAARVGWDHPIVVECLDTMLRIARAERGYRGRYVGIRLSAVRETLDRLIGTPGQGGAGGAGDGALSDLLTRIDRGDFERKPDDPSAA